MSRRIKGIGSSGSPLSSLERAWESMIERTKAAEEVPTVESVSAPSTATTGGSDNTPARSNFFFSEDSNPARLAMDMRMGSDPAAAEETPPEEAAGAESVLETAKKGECQTCKNRKYVDGSDDPGVSFKTPTNIAPEQAASAVRSHENEHVVREQAKAQRTNRRVVSQSVIYRTAICPECSRVYISGGTTRTTTMKSQEEQGPDKENTDKKPFSATF